MTLDAVILSWKRTFNLEAIVKSLREQGIVRTIYIWHNYPSRTKVEGAVSVYSDRNFDTFVRHVFALSLDSDYVLFQDDDLVLEGDNSAVLKRFIRRYGRKSAVMGLIGKKYHRWQKSTVILGRLHLVRRENLVYPLLFERETGFVRNRRIGDDIFLNLTIQHYTKLPSVVIQGLKFRNLPEGEHSKAKKRRWWEKRKRTARSILLAMRAHERRRAARPGPAARR